LVYKLQNINPKLLNYYYSQMEDQMILLYQAVWKKIFKELKKISGKLKEFIKFKDII
jgi:hypothetical protein